MPRNKRARSEPPETLLDVHDLARLLGISKDTVYRLSREQPDFLQPIDVAGRKRWRTRDFNAWVNRRARRAKKAVP
jgi:predicted DNA-binding transcriptional regulator AlpA